MPDTYHDKGKAYWQYKQMNGGKARKKQMCEAEEGNKNSFYDDQVRIGGPLFYCTQHDNKAEYTC